jgi:hypothetical protein
VGEDMPHVKSLLVEMDRGDDPVFVAADIEDVELPDAVDSVECLPEFGKSCESTRLDDVTPHLQRHSRSRISSREGDESTVRYHPHAEAYLKLR